MYNLATNGYKVTWSFHRDWLGWMSVYLIVTADDEYNNTQQQHNLPIEFPSKHAMRAGVKFGPS